MQSTIVWFKTDLRLQDNETLIKAIEKNLPIVPVYCFDLSDYKNSVYGFKRMGSFRFKFLLESLIDLNANLQKLGSGLIIRVGNPDEELVKVAQQYNAKYLFTKKEVAYFELKQFEKVEKALWKINVESFVLSTSTLYHANDLPFSIKDIPDVFTNFRKKVEKESDVRKVFDAPKFINSPILEKCQLPTYANLGLAEPKTSTLTAVPFKGGESEGLQRLKDYLDGTGNVLNYKNTRNGLIGKDYSSKFSLWLANGCISAREVYTNLKKFEAQFGANESTYWLYFELLWRDFFRFMFKKHHQKYFSLYGLKQQHSEFTQHGNHPIELTNWINAQTKSDFVNANMIELRETGFMSNRGRQVVASYLINDLKVDWRFGAAYFEEQLIDYDVCSNWGNWAYLAGVGNDPRNNRYFDTAKQTATYDRNGDYRRRWLKDFQINLG